MTGSSLLRSRAADHESTIPRISPAATVMIPTRNRVSELAKTLASLQRAGDSILEIIVADDASTDGTSEFVMREFPEVTLLTFPRNVGSVIARNTILQRSAGEFVIGLDDDSRFVSSDAISQVLHRMRCEPDLGVVSFQPIGPEHPERMTDSGRLQGEWHTSSFSACGFAIRRSILDRTGPLPDFFFHMYDEPDLCLRVWDAGFRVLQWNEIVVEHSFSPAGRNEQRNHRLHSRNEACSVWMRYPWRLALPAVGYRMAAQAAYARRRGWLRAELRVWLETAALLPAALKNRRPVSERAIKICVAVNRVRVSDPEKVWELGRLPWRTILSGRMIAT